MSLRKLTNILFIVATTILIFATGFRVGEHFTKKNYFSILNSSSTDNKPGVNLSLFWETWEKLEKKYVDKKKVEQKKMLYGAIKGMVASLEDPYTFFLTPEENKQSKQDLQGRFEGIGAQLGLKNNRVIVVAPLKNSPAERAGVKSSDFINKVDDQSTKNWTLTQAVNKIRGPKGTKVKLTLERNGKEFVAEIVRDEINVASVELSYEKIKAKKIAILKLTQFGDNTYNEWDSTIDEVHNLWQKKEIAGLILDLRDNPGGYLDGAVYLAGEFLPLGKTIVQQESTTVKNKTYSVTRQGLLLDIPLVVIINRGSASASEILAGALRDHQRAKLIGEKTFGKGSVQEALDLDQGAGLHVTVAKWILPNGDWINSKGIDPEFKIELKLDEGNTLTREKDIQLNKALEIMYSSL